MNVPPLFHSTVTTNTSTRALPIKVFLHSNNVKKRASSTKKKTCTSSSASTKKQNEIRRFRADTTIGFEQLKKEIVRISRLDNRNLKIAYIRYKDEDGDMIAVDSEEEWKEALICVSTLSVCIIEADIETVEVKKQEEEVKKPVEEKKEEVKKPVEQQPTTTTANNKSVVVHKGIICDGCQKHGIEGTRYKCAHCPDFDLCHSCFAKRNTYPINHPTHIFVPIEKPIPAHTNVVTHIVWDKPVEKTVEVKPQEKKVEPTPKPVEVVEPPKPIEVVKPVEQPKPVEVKPVEQPKPVVEVKPVEAVKPVEKKPVDPALAKYIEILTSMGFDNQDLCVFLLKKHNNNIQRVVDEYLKHQQ